MEEYDIMGYIGKSTGSIKIPLLINNINSTGGPVLLDNCIVKITEDKKVLYEHPNYYLPFDLKVKNITNKKLLDKSYNYTVSGHANFKTKQQAEKWKEFIKGTRNAK